MLKYSLLVEWIENAKKLNTEEELLFPVINRVEQKRLANSLRRELKIMSEIDPVEASRLEIHTYFRDSKHWVGIKKIPGTPLIAFKKLPGGKVERVEIK